MSLNKEELIQKFIRELIRQELDEANSTASVGGSYNTPHAFGGSNKKGKKKGKAGYTGGHTEPTDGTGHFIADDPKLRKTESIVNEDNFRSRAMDDIDEIHTLVKYLASKIAKEDRRYGTKATKEYIKFYKQHFMKFYTGVVKSAFNLLSDGVIKEGRYHAWRNDERLSPKQKIGIAMRETRDSLNELERVVNYNVKLKNEMKVDSRDYWKNTHKALGKISERLVKLANKVGQLH